MKRLAASLLVAAAGCGGAPVRPPPRADKLTIDLIDPGSHLGNVAVLLPDGRGLVQERGEDTIRIVDPTTGAELGTLDAALPSYQTWPCELRGWGTTPALVCDLEAIYRLDGGAWVPVTRAATDGAEAVELSDDGVHVGYANRRCPGEPQARATDGRTVTCLFGPSGWRHVDVVGDAVTLGMRGARLAMLVAAPDAVSRVDWIDAETGESTGEPLPTFQGNDPYWQSPHLDVDWDVAAAPLYLHGQSQVEGIAEAGLLAVRSPDGTYTTVVATDAPRERWGVQVAFADERDAIAAGSFYENIYYTTDAGAHWTAVAGLDPARDAQAPTGRLMEDSAMGVHCDATRTCRVRLNSPRDLVVRFPATQ